MNTFCAYRVGGVGGLARNKRLAMLCPRAALCAKLPARRTSAVRIVKVVATKNTPATDRSTGMTGGEAKSAKNIGKDIKSPAQAMDNKEEAIEAPNYALWMGSLLGVIGTFYVVVFYAGTASAAAQPITPPIVESASKGSPVTKGAPDTKASTKAATDIIPIEGEFSDNNPFPNAKYPSFLPGFFYLLSQKVDFKRKDFVPYSETLRLRKAEEVAEMERMNAVKASSALQVLQSDGMSDAPGLLVDGHDARDPSGIVASESEVATYEQPAQVLGGESPF